MNALSLPVHCCIMWLVYLDSSQHSTLLPVKTLKLTLNLKRTIDSVLVAHCGHQSAVYTHDYNTNQYRKTAIMAH